MAKNLLGAMILDMSDNIDMSSELTDYEIDPVFRDGFYIGDSVGNLIVVTAKGKQRTIPVTNYSTVHVRATKIIKAGTTVTAVQCLRMQE